MKVNDLKTVQRYLRYISRKVDDSFFVCEKYNELSSPYLLDDYYEKVGEDEFVRLLLPSFLNLAAAMRHYQRANNINGVISVSYIEKYPVSMRAEFYSDLGYYSELFESFNAKVVKPTGVYPNCNGFDYAVGQVDFSATTHVGDIRKIHEYSFKNIT